MPPGSPPRLRYDGGMAASDEHGAPFRVDIPPGASPSALVVVALELLAEAARRAYANSTLGNLSVDEVFTTRRGEGPPGVRHRRWQKIAPTIPSAYRESRYWIVPRRAYYDFVRLHSQRRPQRERKG